MPSLSKPTNGVNTDYANRIGALFDAINSGTGVKGTTTPTPTATSGTFTSVSASVSYTEYADRVFVRIRVTITTNGTAATSVKVPLPFTPAEVTALCGVESQATGVALTGYFNTDGIAHIFKYDGTYPGADGRSLEVAGEFRK